MIWCPRGQFIVLAGLGQPINGQIEFWNAKDMELMGTGEHFMCSDIEWDPSGRYVISSVSAWKERVSSQTQQQQKETNNVVLMAFPPPSLLG